MTEQRFIVYQIIFSLETNLLRRMRSIFRTNSYSCPLRVWESCTVHQWMLHLIYIDVEKFIMDVSMLSKSVGCPLPFVGDQKNIAWLLSFCFTESSVHLAHQFIPFIQDSLFVAVLCLDNRLCDTWRFTGDPPPPIKSVRFEYMLYILYYNFHIEVRLGGWGLRGRRPRH